MQDVQRTHTQHVCSTENGLNWKSFGHSALLWLDMEGCDVTFALRAAWKQTWNAEPTEHKLRVVSVVILEFLRHPLHFQPYLICIHGSCKLNNDCLSDGRLIHWLIVVLYVVRPGNVGHHFKRVKLPSHPQDFDSSHIIEDYDSATCYMYWYFSVLRGNECCFIT